MDANSLSYPVYLGVWTNWSHGRVLGITLTLTRTSGAFLIAFVALFVTIVGARAWRIICYITFKTLSNLNPQDALYHQRQAILRNSSSPIGGTLLLIQTLQAWASSDARAAKARPLKRLLPLLLGALLLGLGFTAASGLSSQIARGSEVLIDGSKCGIVVPTRFDPESTVLTLYNPYGRRQTEQAADYALRCYESSSQTDNCGTFVRGALPMTITANASCPFDDELCISQDSNLIVEVGPVDSLADLGLNWPPSSRFQLHHRLHCAPLASEQYRTTYVLGNVTYERYQYGDASIPPSDCNCTVAANTDLHRIRSQVNILPFYQPIQDYSLISVWAQFSRGSYLPQWSLFEPLPGLSRHNGDVSLTFLFPNEVVFLEESQDIWYRANTPIQKTYVVQNPDQSANFTVYGPDEAAWPMGCVEQFQVCKQGTCSGWGPRNDTVQSLYKELGMNSDFLGPASYIGIMSHPSNLITALGKESLASRYKTADSLQTGAGPNEWHLDVIHWVSTLSSALQLQLAEIASGPSLNNPQLEDYVARPNATERSKYCNSQKIRSTAYTSFSMFGLLFIFTTGTIIILASATMELLDTFRQKLFAIKSNGYSGLEWRASHPFHLQRLAQGDIIDPEEWKLGAYTIPITETDAKLAVLNMAQLGDLPRLSKQTENSSPADKCGSIVTAGARHQRHRVEHYDEGLRRATTDSSEATRLSLNE